MGDNRKYLEKKSNEQFVSDVSQHYQNWLARNNLQHSIENTMQFFVSHNFVRQSIINRYRVLVEYDRVLPETISERYPRGNKTHAIWDIEEKVPLCEAQIKSIICNHSTYFKENRLKF